MRFKTIHRAVAFLIGLFSFFIYYMTMAPTVSFWDCGEYIACSYRMGISHPPGAPLFLLLARIFTLFPLAKDIALRVNLISVLASALTVSLIYLIIVHTYREWKGQLNSDKNWITAIFSGILGSLSFGFTHSFWFNAVEAEVYALSTCCMALLIWLILLWQSKADEPGNERFLLLIAYLIGLSTGIHLLTILVLPFLCMIFYFKKYRFTWRGFLILSLITAIIILGIFPGITVQLPQLAAKAGILPLFIIFFTLTIFIIRAYKQQKHYVSAILSFILLILIGYSSYTSVIIRSSLNPKIDMNNPENLEQFYRYVNREQYGNHSVTDRLSTWQASPDKEQYGSALSFFWNYQIKKMYLRYFLWQFVGKTQDGINWSFTQFWGLPLLLGLLGMCWHFRQSPQQAFSVLILFIMTGLAIVIYLNQPDPQPRERDYSYVGSFFAFSIWIGLGFAALKEIFKPLFQKGAKTAFISFQILLLVALIFAAPAQMLEKNYQDHNRQGNYLARDFAYNVLMSCQPNSILFTNGDNDTYPLWYLQEVEGIRTDVRVVCLQLLQTGWHTKQLRDQYPKVPMQLTDADIENMRFILWQKQKILLKIPEDSAQKFQREYKEEFPHSGNGRPDHIIFKINPSFETRQGPLLGIMQQMILNIIYSNSWKKPVHFAVTMPQEEVLSELAQFLRLDGLAYTLVPFREWDFSPVHLKNNLMHQFSYRNLNNQDVYYNNSEINLLQHYRNAFIQLATYHARQDDKKSLQDTLYLLDQKIPESIIPYTNHLLKLYIESLKIVADIYQLDLYKTHQLTEQDVEFMGQLFLINFKQPLLAAQFLERIYNSDSSNSRIIGLLIQAYLQSDSASKAIQPLQHWLKLHPSDRKAHDLLKDINNKKI
jgi:hypothetical protein